MLTKDEIALKFFDRNGAVSIKKVSANMTPEIESWMESVTDYQGDSVKSKIYAVYHGVAIVPVCRKCARQLEVDHLGHSREFCSLGCLNSSQEMKDMCSSSLKEAWKTRSDEILSKRKKTNLERYGFEHVLQDREKAAAAQAKCRDKKAETFRRKREEYAAKMIPLPQQAHLTPETLGILRDETELRRMFSIEELPLGTMAERIGCSPSTVSNRIAELGWTRKNWYTQGEFEIAEWIKDKLPGETVILRDRKEFANKQELDIWLPDRRLAIDFHGMYWHSDAKGIDPKRHQDLYLSNKERGIRLIQIFEDEWLNRRRACWSILLNAIGKTEVAYARECEVREVPADVAVEFMEAEHLAGSAKSSIRLGLYQEERLMSVMTFARSRFTSHDWEIIRFATKLGWRIPGGASRLLHHFRRNHPGSIATYADLRLGTGGTVYEKLGFRPLGITRPGYFWYLKGQRIPRIITQKKRLPTLLGDRFDSSKTEDQNMHLVGAHKVHDAGHARFELV